MAQNTSLEKLLKRRSQRTSLDLPEPTLKPVAEPVDTFARPAIPLPIDQREATGRWVGAMTKFNSGLVEIADKVNKEMEYQRAIETGDAISQAVDSYYAESQGKVTKLTEQPLPGEAVANSQEGLTPSEAGAVRDAVNEEATVRLGFPEQREKAIGFLQKKGLDVTLFPRQMRLFDQLLARKYAISAKNYVAENWAALTDPYSKKTVRGLMAESVGKALGNPDLTFEEIISQHPTLAAELTEVAEKTEDAAKRGKSGAKLKQMETEVLTQARDAFTKGLNASVAGDLNKAKAAYRDGFLLVNGAVDMEGNWVTFPGGGAAMRYKLNELAQAQLNTHASVPGNFIDGAEIIKAGQAVVDGFNIALGRGRPVPEANTTIGPDALNEEASVMEDPVKTLERQVKNNQIDAQEEAQGKPSQRETREPEITAVWPKLQQIADNYDKVTLKEFMKILPTYLVHNLPTALVDWDGDPKTPPTTLEDHYEDNEQTDLLHMDIDISDQQGLFDIFKKHMIETEAIPPRVFKKMTQGTLTKHWTTIFDGQIKAGLNEAIRNLQKTAQGNLTASATVVRNTEFLQQTSDRAAKRNLEQATVDRTYAEWEKTDRDDAAEVATIAHSEALALRVEADKAFVLNDPELGGEDLADAYSKRVDPDTGLTKQQMLDEVDENGRFIIGIGPLRNQLQKDIDRPILILPDIATVAEAVHAGGELTPEAQGSRNQGELRQPGSGGGTSIQSMVPGTRRWQAPLHKSFMDYGSNKNGYKLQDEYRKGLEEISTNMRNNKNLARDLFAAKSPEEREQVITKYSEIGFNQRDALRERIHKKGSDLKREEAAGVADAQQTLTSIQGILVASRKATTEVLATLENEIGNGVNAKNLLVLGSKNEHDQHAREIMFGDNKPDAVNLLGIMDLSSVSATHTFDGTAAVLNNHILLKDDVLARVQKHLAPVVGWDISNVVQIDQEGNITATDRFGRSGTLDPKTSVFRTVPEMTAWVKAHGGDKQSLRNLYDAIIDHIPIDPMTGEKLAYELWYTDQVRNTLRTGQIASQLHATNRIAANQAAIGEQHFLPELYQNIAYGLAGRLNAESFTGFFTPIEKAAVRYDSLSAFVGKDKMGVGAGAITDFGEYIAGEENNVRGAWKSAAIWTAYILGGAAVGIGTAMAAPVVVPATAVTGAAGGVGVLAGSIGAATGVSTLLAESAAEAVTTQSAKDRHAQALADEAKDRRLKDKKNNK